MSDPNDPTTPLPESHYDELIERPPVEAVTAQPEPPEADAFAEGAYRAYNASTGGLNYRGEPCPDWADLPETQRTAWAAAVDWLLEAADTEDGDDLPDPGWPAS